VTACLRQALNAAAPRNPTQRSRTPGRRPGSPPPMQLESASTEYSLFVTFPQRQLAETDLARRMEQHRRRRPCSVDCEGNGSTPHVLGRAPELRPANRDQRTEREVVVALHPLGATNHLSPSVGARSRSAAEASDWGEAPSPRARRRPGVPRRLRADAREHRWHASRERCDARGRAIFPCSVINPVAISAWPKTTIVARGAASPSRGRSARLGLPRRCCCTPMRRVDEPA
jgi:hypothetical protein